MVSEVFNDEQKIVYGLTNYEREITEEGIATYQ